ncbi:sensor histidine kinase [Roseovarius sp. 217]|uniref:sensor histidine kinase n=2 Tax=unclassified Roseovarius TaxID=2614913 RepID=UPI000322CB53|nr:HAMP domain-containing sensor histidine kinase [Roseovarius sp. 217]
MQRHLMDQNVTEAGARRRQISFAFVWFGLVFTFGWMVLTALSGEIEVFLIGAQAFSGFALVRLFKTRLPLVWANTCWLTSTNVAIFLGACVVHPTGQVDIMLIPMVGFPFAVFSIYRDRFHIAVLVALPVVLWAVWFVTQGNWPLIIGEATAERIYAPMAALTAFSTIVYPVLYFAIVSAQHSLEIKRARRDAEQSSRAKTVLLSGISHEMRTPLNAVIGLADLLRDDAQRSGDVRQAEYANRIMEAGETLLATVDKTMHFADIAARRTSVTLAPVRVALVIDRVVARYQEEALRRGVLLQVEDTKATVLANTALFEDALGQLVENGVRYCGSAGTVWVQVKSERAGYHRITIADNGPGFGAVDPALAFAPFERLAHATGTTFGAGMGLALARIKAEAMSGTVGIDFDVPSGARVWIELPASIEAAAS